MNIRESNIVEQSEVFLYLLFSSLRVFLHAHECLVLVALQQPQGKHAFEAVEVRNHLDVVLDEGRLLHSRFVEHVRFVFFPAKLRLLALDAREGNAQDRLSLLPVE